MESTKKKNSNLELIGAFLLIAFAAAFGFFRARYSLSFGDEGHSLSVPLRYTLGDVPFRDEVLNPLRWFDILMAPLMPLLPKKGSVLFLRYATLIVQFLSLAALLNALKKYIPLLVIAAIIAATIYSNFFSLWTPTYHTATSDFFFLCLAFWFYGRSSRTHRGALAWGLAAGGMFFLAVFCEIPTIVLLAVPASAAAWALKKREAKSALFVSTAALLATACALALAAFGVLLASGLYPDLISALALQQTIVVYGSSIGFRLAWVLKDLALAAPYCVFHMIFWFAAAALLSARPRLQKSQRSFHAAGAAGILILYTAISLIFIVKTITEVNSPQVVHFLEGLSLLSMILFPLHRLFRARAWPEDMESGFFSILYVFGLLFHFLLGMICHSGLLVGTVITFPFQFILLIMTMSRWFTPTRGIADSARGSAGTKWIPMTALCVCIAAITFTANLYSTNRYWIWQYDAKFESGKLRGIYLTRELVATTDAVVDFLKPRTKKGDFLLTFYENPMLNYLTETRSALPTGFPSWNWPMETRAQFVRDMVERRRVPRYAVSYGGVSREPIYDFVTHNYRPVVRYGQYVIWEHKDNNLNVNQFDRYHYWGWGARPYDTIKAK